MELNRMKIGAAIAARRKEKGLTQEQLAARLGVSAPAVSKWETDTSYPDITLLCPLARALGTSVDALLQFEETLSDEEVVRQINQLLETAMRQQPDGWQAAERQLEELLHQYPSCTALQYNAVASYDALTMFFPAAGEEVRTRWRARKRQLLEQVRESGNAAYWQTATIGLAVLELTDGDAETGAALLRQLPERVGDPTGAWAQYYLKTGQPGKALETIQKQLYKLISQAQSLLATMMNPKLLPEPERQRAVCEAYGALARAFDFPDMSAGLAMELCLQEGQPDEAAACFARYVEVLTGPPAFPRADIFAPGVTAKHPESAQASHRELRRLLLDEIHKEEKYRPLLDHPVFAAALARLEASV